MHHSPLIMLAAEQDARRSSPQQFRDKKIDSALEQSTEDNHSHVLNERHHSTNPPFEIPIRACRL